MKNIFKSAMLVAGFTAMTLGSAVAENLNVATINMQKLFEEFYKTKETREELKDEQTRIQKDNNERLVAIRAIEKDLETLRKKLQDPSISDKKRTEVQAEMQKKLNEGNHLDKDRRHWLERRKQALQEVMNNRSRANLEIIQEVVTKHASEKDIDFVLDNSGRSLNQLPMIIHSKDKFDITAEILKELNKDAPKEEPKENGN